MSDPVNPNHYKSGGIECIDAMKACSTPEEFRGHLKLTVLKYLWREDKKGEGDQARVENLEKAAWYLERLIRDLRGDKFEISKEVWDSGTGLSYIPDAETIPPHTINAADQGWVEWRGGFCPVLGGAWVEVDYGDGPEKGPAGSFDWQWTTGGNLGDITRYRVVK